MPMKGEDHITGRLSYHNYCCVKHNIFINKQRSYCGNGAAYTQKCNGADLERKICRRLGLNTDLIK